MPGKKSEEGTVMGTVRGGMSGSPVVRWENGEIVEVQGVYPAECSASILGNVIGNCPGVGNVWEIVLWEMSG